jgi:hypothetical protein
LMTLFASKALAMDLSLMPIARSYPTSGSIEAQARDEILLWDQRDQAKWRFGFLQPRLLVAAHGVLEGGLYLYPVSILELGASYSTTSRFYKTKPFDCDANVCGGIVQRHRFSSRLALAQDLSTFRLLEMVAYHRTRISSGDNSKPLVDESEVLLAQPGSDTVESTSFMLAGQKDDRVAGVYMKKGRMLDSHAENESQYLMLKQKLQNFSVAGAVGRYASDYHDPSLSVIASVVWNWGESISLF